MAYCTNAKLTSLTGTSLSTAVQDDIIDQSDRKINAKLRTEGLTPPDADDDLKAASLDLSYVAVLTHPDNDDGATRVKLGDIDIAREWKETLADHTKSAWASMDAYIARLKGYECPLPGIAIVGRTGVRVGEYEEMPNEDDY